MKAKISLPKAPMPKAKTIKKGSAKPHIRMRKLKPVPAGAFPQSPMAFPTDPGAMVGPQEAMAASPGGMPSAAGPGSMGE